MMIETYKNEGSSLKIGTPCGYPLEIQEKCLELTALYTEPDKRGQGFARKLMELVCQIADKEQKALILQVRPYDTIQNDSNRLLSFYESLGFAVFQAEPCLMCRPPRPPKWTKLNQQIQRMMK